MLFPERSDHPLTYLVRFLANLAQLYCSKKHNPVPIEWTLGDPLQRPQVPSLGQHGNEQIQVGFNLAHGTEIIHQSTWGFIEDVAVLRHSNVGQFAQGWKRRNTITKSSYWAVANFSGKSKIPWTRWRMLCRPGLCIKHCERAKHTQMFIHMYAFEKILPTGCGS